MKPTYKTLAAVAVVLTALVPAFAQKTTAKVNVPFAFTVDDIRMPAGEYLVSSPSEKVITIQRVGGAEVKATITNSSAPTRTNGPAKLVFHRYGSQYFVAVAWMPNSDHAQEFFTSASEIEVARNMKQEQLELAMNVAE